jgi:hypothetical protein
VLIGGFMPVRGMMFKSEGSHMYSVLINRDGTVCIHRYSADKEWGYSDDRRIKVLPSWVTEKLIMKNSHDIDLFFNGTDEEIELMLLSGALENP